MANNIGISRPVTITDYRPYLDIVLEEGGDIVGCINEGDYDSEDVDIEVYSQEGFYYTVMQKDRYGMFTIQSIPHGEYEVYTATYVIAHKRRRVSLPFRQESKVCSTAVITSSIAGKYRL